MATRGPRGGAWPDGTLRWKCDIGCAYTTCCTVVVHGWMNAYMAPCNAHNSKSAAASMWSTANLCIPAAAALAGIALPCRPFFLVCGFDDAEGLASKIQGARDAHVAKLGGAATAPKDEEMSH